MIKDVRVIIRSEINSKNTKLNTKRIVHSAILYIIMLFNASQDRSRDISTEADTKPGKPTGEVSSYRAIRLLPILSKLFKNNFVRMDTTRITEKRQFDLKTKHSTIQHIYRLLKISNMFRN